MAPRRGVLRASGFRLSGEGDLESGLFSLSGPLKALELELPHLMVVPHLCNDLDSAAAPWGPLLGV